MKTHQQIDARSLDFHRLIAAHLRANPEKFALVQSTIARFRQMCDLNSQFYLKEWERLVRAGMEDCLEMATREGEFATAMRQSSPFAGVIPPREREKFFRDWARQHEA